MLTMVFRTDSHHLFHNGPVFVNSKWTRCTELAGVCRTLQFVQTLPHTGPGHKAPGTARSVHPKTSGRIDTPHATDSKVRSTPELLFGASNQEKNRPARKKTRSERGYGESNNSLSPIYFCQITLPHAGLSSCFSLLLVLTRFSLIVNFFMSNPPKGGDIDEQGRSC